MATLLELEGLLVLILVPPVLTAWTGRQRGGGQGWGLMGEPHHTRGLHPASDRTVTCVLQEALPASLRWAPGAQHAVRRGESLSLTQGDRAQVGSRGLL